MSLAEVNVAEGEELSLDLSDIPQHLWHLLPPPGAIFDIWSPTTDEAGWKVICEELDRIDSMRVRQLNQLPIEAPETASALLQLLAQQKKLA